ELDDSILGGGTSLGVHESQSRMWENVIGRSRPFWQHFYPDLQKTFPDALKGVDVESFYKSINASKPSLIRVEADEVTYNLHIMIRFELETAVLNNKLAIRDLPDAWNATTEDYLGITPPDNALGILQDVHWSGGVMGYFPTYALGNLLSIQFYDKAIAAHPEIPEETGRGEFGTLLNWLRENIHRHGSKYESMELVQRVTGEKIQTKSFMNYLRTKYSDIYGL
ncbi:MAG TPA: carboxypeptidase M32, partial [Aggregatilineales bacterium]|nr:carboxypeptidase M32 [Aggregatilineales bacterium]